MPPLIEISRAPPAAFGRARMHTGCARPGGCACTARAVPVPTPPHPSSFYSSSSSAETTGPHVSLSRYFYLFLSLCPSPFLHSFRPFSLSLELEIPCATLSRSQSLLRLAQTPYRESVGMYMYQLDIASLDMIIFL